MRFILGLWGEIATFRSTSVRISLSISDLGNDSSSPCWGLWCGWWLGDGADDIVGLFCSEGERSCTGTFEKCSVGIRIFVWHLAQTVRLQSLQRMPRELMMPNFVRRQRKQIFRFSTSSLIWMPTGRLSSSALVMTERIWTISSSVSESRSASRFTLHWFSSSEFFDHESIDVKLDTAPVDGFVDAMDWDIIAAADDGGSCCGGKWTCCSADCLDSGRDDGTDLLSWDFFRLWQPTMVCRRIEARRDSHCVARS